MAVSLKHNFVSVKGDGADPTQVQPSHWNAEHDITMGGAKLLGRGDASEGPVGEVTVGSGLDLSALNVLTAIAATMSTNRMLGRTTAASGAYEEIEVLQGLVLAAGKLKNTGYVPVGTVVDYAAPVAPDGWVLCYGQELSRVTYAALAAALTTVHGAYTDGAGGVGTTHFRVPDYRGRVGAGKDDMGGTPADRITNTGDGNPGFNGKTLGAAGGQDRRTLTVDQMPLHGHPTRMSNANGANSDLVGGIMVAADSTQNKPAYTGAVSNALGEQIGGSGSSEAHPNVQPTIIINKIIFHGVYPA